MDENNAIEVFQAALPFKNLIVGVGLDSYEVGNPPSKFINVYKMAKSFGFKLCAHAGEEGPP